VVCGRKNEAILVRGPFYKTKWAGSEPAGDRLCDGAKNGAIFGRGPFYKTKRPGLSRLGTGSATGRKNEAIFVRGPFYKTKWAGLEPVGDPLCDRGEKTKPFWCEVRFRKQNGQGLSGSGTGPATGRKNEAILPPPPFYKTKRPGQRNIRFSRIAGHPAPTRFRGWTCLFPRRVSHTGLPDAS